MLKRNLGLLTFTAFLLGSVSAIAADCLEGNVKTADGARAPGTQANRDQVELEKKIDERFADDGSASALYFVIPRASGEPEIVRLPVNTLGNNDRVQIPADLARKLSAAGQVKVFNKLNGTDFPYVASFYFVPYTAVGLKSMKPLVDFPAANKEGRRGTSGCSLMSFKGHETLTLVHGNTAKRAEDVVKYDGIDETRALTDKERELFTEASGMLNKKLGIAAGPNRSPASGGAAPVYRTVEKHLPSDPQPVGHRPAKEQTPPAQPAKRAKGAR